MNDFPLIRVAIFASGAGSNAARIIDFMGSAAPRDSGVRIAISLIVSNKPTAGVLEIARKAGIPTLLLDRKEFYESGDVVRQLKAAGIDFIVLAGFLWKIPALLVQAFPDRILNIHPALLPLYGGKGMYGHFVHEAVIAAGEKESGITIHYVDDHYDHGKIFFQARCAVAPGETPETLAEKIHRLEYEFFPPAILRWIQSNYR